MQNRYISLLGIFVTVGIVYLILMFAGPKESDPAKPALVIGNIDTLAPSGAGLPSSAGPSKQEVQSPPKDAYIGGTKAVGRVAEIYLKVGQGVFLALDQAPATLRNSAEHWVVVEFPELLANGSGDARAFVGRGQDDVGIGDLVEVKFAHRTGSRAFPVPEITRVTEHVAKRGEMLAQNFERRILARTGHGAPDAGVQLSQRPGDFPAWLHQAQNPLEDLTRSAQAASTQSR